MSNDLISRSALEQSFDEGCVGECGCCEHHHCEHVSFGKWNEWCKLIRNAPTIDAVEVVHGQWILGVPITCSVCGKPAAEHDSPISFWESPYCPWCGAKMDGGAE